MRKRRMVASDVKRNMRWGAGAGFLLGCVYSVIALVIHATKGREPFEANDASLASVLFVYLGGGVVGGAIIGLLRPLAKWRFGAVIMGIAAMLPISLGVNLAVSPGISEWTIHNVNKTLLVAIILGGLGGYVSWDTSNRDE